MKLGDVAEITGGYAFKSTELTKSRLSNEYLPVVKIGNLTKLGILNLTDVEFHKYHNELSKFIVRNGDILIAMTGATVGKMAISNLDNLLLNQRVGLIRPTQNLVLREYIKNLLFSGDFYRYCQSTAGGGAQGNISPSQIMGYRIPLPPLPSQHKIVEILEEADNLRRLRRQADEKMKDLIPSLFVEMFGDPATNPKGWKQVELGSIVESLRNGLNKKQSDNGNLPITRIETIANGNIDKNKVKYVEVTKGEYSIYRLLQGDILFSHINSIEHLAKTAIYLGEPEELIHGVNLLLLRPNKDINPQYLHLWLKNENTRNQFRARARKAVNQASLNTRDIVTVLIPLPPLSPQQEFAERVKEVEAEKERQAESRKKLDDLFNSLMQRAFKGELVA